ncbi:uncharacterized protein N7484_001868 [Penicillium longicatenatum]|uniref:uncharacterized protein n=1 Tax=Penicillium longicatenatum TaxID=1561947 RepID=UPI002547AA37|nr:uncharacterized protein N7484_001868 [Penicillium longicatenatum]KAJ5658219.1 hypothetical protein N7484_001868 [Penicillium longicatenatum]
MSYFEKLPEAIVYEASSTKPWYTEPSSMKTDPIIINDESSTKPEPRSTKRNPIMIDDESSLAIKFGELLEELTYDTA